MVNVQVAINSLSAIHRRKVPDLTRQLLYRVKELAGLQGCWDLKDVDPTIGIVLPVRERDLWPSGQLHPEHVDQRRLAPREGPSHHAERKRDASFLSQLAKHSFFGRGILWISASTGEVPVARLPLVRGPATEDKNLVLGVEDYDYIRLPSYAHSVDAEST